MVTCQTRTGRQALCNLWVTFTSAIAVSLTGCGSYNPQSSQATVTVTVPNVSDVTSTAQVPEPDIVDGSLLHRFASRIEQLERNSARCTATTEPDWSCDFQRTDRLKLLDYMAAVIELQYDKTRYQYIFEAADKAHRFIDLALQDGCQVDARPGTNRNSAGCAASLLVFDSSYRQALEH